MNLNSSLLPISGISKYQAREAGDGGVWISGGSDVSVGKMMHGMTVYIHLWMCDKKENCGMRYGYPIIVDLTGPPMPTSFVSDFFRNSSANGYDHYLYGDGYLARFRPGWSWNSSGNNQVAWSEATSTPYDKPWKNAWYIHIHDIPHRNALRCTALHCNAMHCI